ncbi:MAG: ATP-binding cassette domain-containing protein [Fibrobacterales bacterium]
MEVLKLDHIHFSYSKQTVLDDLNLSLDFGETICIFGEGGGGKTSLLRILAGLERPSSGHIRIFGDDIDIERTSALDPLRKEIGYVFQNSALIHFLPVRANIALPLEYENILTPDEIKIRVDSIIDTMLLKEFEWDFPFSLSEGIQKRVAIARTLVMQPKILVMDEPTTGLDLITQKSLLALLFNSSQLHHTSIIIVTHDPNVARLLNAQIMVLHSKKLTKKMSIPEFFDLDVPFVQDMVYDMKEQIESARHESKAD